MPSTGPGCSAAWPAANGLRWAATATCGTRTVALFPASPWAGARGWAPLFAPLRWAHERLGPGRADVAQQWGLPPAAQVHVGVHDSNACLARYLYLLRPDRQRHSG